MAPGVDLRRYAPGAPARVVFLGSGGFAVVETDDPALLASANAVFSAFFDMNVYPVLDIEEAARIGGAAVEFRQSV